MIPPKDTFYLCKIYALPPLERDLHLISFDVVIDKESVDFVHHFDAFLCRPADMEKIANVSNTEYECGPGGEKNGENSLKNVCESRSMIFAWVSIIFMIVKKID